MKDYGIVSQKHYLVHQGYLNTEFYGRRKPGAKPYVFLFSDMMLLCVEVSNESEKPKYVVEVSIIHSLSHSHSLSSLSGFILTLILFNNFLMDLIRQWDIMML
jgi:hypothetical protein